MAALQYLALKAEIEQSKGWHNYIKDTVNKSVTYFGYIVKYRMLRRKLQLFMFAFDPVDIAHEYLRRLESVSRQTDPDEVTNFKYALLIKQGVGTVEQAELCENQRYYTICSDHLISYINLTQSPLPLYGTWEYETLEYFYNRSLITDSIYGGKIAPDHNIKIKL